MAAPATCPVALRARIRRCRFAHPLPIMVVIVARETAMETELDAGGGVLGWMCTGSSRRSRSGRAGWCVRPAGSPPPPEGVRAFVSTRCYRLRDRRSSKALNYLWALELFVRSMLCEPSIAGAASLDFNDEIHLRGPASLGAWAEVVKLDEASGWDFQAAGS